LYRAHSSVIHQQGRLQKKTIWIKNSRPL